MQQRTPIAHVFQFKILKASDHFPGKEKTSRLEVWRLVIISSEGRSVVRNEKKYTTNTEIHYKYRNTPQIQGCWLFGAKAEAGVRSSPVQFWQIIGQASASQLNVAPLPLHE